MRSFLNNPFLSSFSLFSSLDKYKINGQWLYITALALVAIALASSYLSLHSGRVVSSLGFAKNWKENFFEIFRKRQFEWPTLWWTSEPSLHTFARRLTRGFRRSRCPRLPRRRSWKSWSAITIASHSNYRSGVLTCIWFVSSFVA